jgi:hypothetical protein
MEAKVILCDSCKERVAKLKCCFCMKDICDSCKTTIKTALEFNSRNILMFKDIVCYKCSDSLSELSKIEDDLSKSKVMLDVLKNFIALKELKKGEKV